MLVDEEIILYEARACGPGPMETMAMAKVKCTRFGVHGVDNIMHNT